MIVCVFEDKMVENLWPLTATRPVYDLLLGTSTLLEKISTHLGQAEELILFTRPYLEKIVSEKYPELRVNIVPEGKEVLLINGRAVLNHAIAEHIRNLSLGQALKTKETVVAVKTLSSNVPENFWETLSGAVTTDELLRLSKDIIEMPSFSISYPWDIISYNETFIESEARGEPLKENVKGTVLKLGESEVEENVVIDGRKGPVVLGENVVVESFSKIIGPCFLGNGTRVFSGSVVSRSSFGRVCRIGGEVEASVFLGFSNKRHYGYLGHSVIGEWVNIGAGTTVSNLKNTYGTVKVNIGGRRVDTGRQFLGCFIGDHAKTGIGCMISGGVKIGVSSHVYREAVTDVPSFTIHTPYKRTELMIESALQTADRMMVRRGVDPSHAYLQMLVKVFELTSSERIASGVTKGKFSFYNAGTHSAYG
ncbi:MAG: putative sugar nucleotidyl transferase [Candidatus Caldarchaeum sp.]|nr:putative sugar nucleotidyl transferase [Candidatus Caldarchaeum sp.]